MKLIQLNIRINGRLVSPSPPQEPSLLEGPADTPLKIIAQVAYVAAGVFIWSLMLWGITVLFG